MFAKSVCSKREYQIDIRMADSRQHLRGPFLVVDVGAKLGFRAISFVKRYPRAVVFALEPDPLLFRLMLWNLRANNVTGSVWPLNIAASDRQSVGWCSPYPRPHITSRDDWLGLAADCLSMGFNDGYHSLASNAEATTQGCDGSSFPTSKCCFVRAFSLFGLLQTLHIDHVNLLEFDCAGCDRHALSDPNMQEFLGRGGINHVRGNWHNLSGLDIFPDSISLPHVAIDISAMSCPEGSLRRARLDPLHVSAIAGKGQVYQFGVLDGESLQEFRKVYPFTLFWGFDSFKGLPRTEKDIKIENWHEGQFSTTYSLDDLVGKVGQPVKFIEGFYNESLIPGLNIANNMQPAEFIDIDVDLYISAVQALDWVFSSGIAVRGTIIGYDDWWFIPCTPKGHNLHPLETGEGKAHYEMTRKHGVRFRCVAGPCRRLSEDEVRANCMRPHFVIEAIGDASQAWHGFELTDQDIWHWKQGSLTCRHLNVTCRNPKAC